MKSLLYWTLKNYPFANLKKGYEIVSTTLKIQRNYVEIFAMTFVNKLTNFLVVYIYDNVHEEALLFEPEQFIWNTDTKLDIIFNQKEHSYILFQRHKNFPVKLTSIPWKTKFLQLYLEKDSGTSVSLWILWNFQEHLFYRTPLVAASDNYIIT